MGHGANQATSCCVVYDRSPFGFARLRTNLTKGTFAGIPDQMLGQTLSIARNTFIEAIRQPIFIILVMISGIAQIFSTWGTGFSMGYSSTAELSSDNKLMLDYGLATVFLCGMLLAAFVASAVVSREIEDKTILTVVSKPISRASVILGKYIGVAAAISMALVIMLIFLLFAVRHGVMSNASDHLDAPLLTFALGAVGLSVFVGIWCNYFYGWVFSQTTMVLLLPLTILAYVLVLLIDKEWNVQAIYRTDMMIEFPSHIETITQEEYIGRYGGIDFLPANTDKVKRVPVFTEFKPQVTIACMAVGMAVLLLASVATAVSTRLGQVMTLVVCSGVFLMGLLSNHFIGRRAFDAQHVARLIDAAPNTPEELAFAELGDEYVIHTERPPVTPLSPGTPIYYAESPNGLNLVSGRFPDPEIGDEMDIEALYGAEVPPSIISVDDSFSSAGDIVRIRLIGARPLAVGRPPQKGDYIFTEPPTKNLAAIGLWGVIPNLQHFWVIDAVTQNHPIPPNYLGSLAIYTGLQVGAFMCLGVILFQKRDVG